jgi:hypothetical protein
MQFGLGLPRRLYRGRNDLREADVGCERWGLGGLEEGREGLQGH